MFLVFQFPHGASTCHDQLLTRADVHVSLHVFFLFSFDLFDQRIWLKFLFKVKLKFVLPWPVV